MTDSSFKHAHPELTTWVESVTGTAIVHSMQLVGGNRRQAWAIDVVDGPCPLFLRCAVGPDQQGADPYTLKREADFYRALKATGVVMPRFIASHPVLPAFLVERVPGESRYAGSADADVLDAIATDFMRRLAEVHALDIRDLDLPAYDPHGDISHHVRAEITIWRSMYEETRTPDPLIEFALQWLTDEMPVVNDAPVLVHGDAGPGNFLHLDGKVTALIDWELAHVGDPMEDIAWASVRTTLEPFPDFRRHVADYVKFCGRAIARDRVRYHRVFVPLRIAVLRHRASCAVGPQGDPANSLISRTLNRRLLVEALAAAAETALPSTEPVPAPPLEQERQYEDVLALLRSKVAPRTTDRVAAAAIKSAARMVKHLAAVHRYGAAVEMARIKDLAALLSSSSEHRGALEMELSRRIRAENLSETALLAFFARDVARDTQLAAPAMGALATRPMPPFE